MLPLGFQLNKFRFWTVRPNKSIEILYYKIMNAPPSLECTKWEASIELAANLRAEQYRACAGRPGHRYSQPFTQI